MLTLRSGPSSDLALEPDTDNLGTLELPRDVGHDIDSVSSSDSARDHTETSSVRGVRIGSDHHSSGEGVVLEDDLMDDTGSGLPETDAVLKNVERRKQRELWSVSSRGEAGGRREMYLGGGGSQEVVNLLVDVVGSGKILDTSDLGLDQVVAVDGSGDGSLGETGRHELEDGHLGSSILAGDSL
jgi:hypothetical protein